MFVVILVIGVSLVTDSFAPRPPRSISAIDQTNTQTESRQSSIVAGSSTESRETSAVVSRSDRSENTPSSVSETDGSVRSAYTPETYSAVVTPKPQQQPTPQHQTQTVSVSLQINGALKGEVTLDDGANHCDVLSSALNAGIIDDLQLKYSDTMKSYGVHVINGQGDSNIVWWVYIVNGKSPPLGCSHILVNNNDTVNWKYIGR